MKATIKPEQWFEENVDIEQLSADVIQDLRDSVNYTDINDSGFYEAHIADIVSSSYGQEIPFKALEYFGYTNICSDNSDINDVLWQLECFSNTVSQLIKDGIKKMCNIYVEVRFEFWHDDAYCLIASLHKNDAHKINGLSV